MRGTGDSGVSAEPPRILLIVENVSIARDHRLRKQVAALDCAGYRVAVICRRDPANSVPDGVRLLEYPAPADARSFAGFLREYAYSWAAAGWLTVRLLRDGGLDAIQISGTPDIYFALAAPLRLFGKRVVLDQRDLSPEIYELRFQRRGAIYWLLRMLERASYRSVDHVMTVNATLAATVRRRGRAAADAVSIVGNGPVLSHTAPRPADVGLRAGRAHLCCWLGVMGPQDQLSLALHAVAHFVHVLGRTDCHFAFIGDGESRADAEQLADRLGIAPFVSFPGWLHEEDVFRYLSSADIGLESNLEDIVSPVKAMEYMAFALPIVAFDVAETRTLAGEAATYVEPADVAAMAGALAALLDDPRRRRTMGSHGRSRVENSLAWDHQQQAYLEIYGRLLLPAGHHSDAAHCARAESAA
ncbi:MAG: glycosyltransferase [Jatrophihabitans sp.]|uniref:glycosyltransferase n=1 Tax=Jatrophihabitans sp. TaxID=1932789 RepID=UPI00391021FE